jgi:UDP-N-acetylmuramyl tripeptide synthase
VLHNRSGSNLMRGLAATLTAAAGLDGRIPNPARTAGVFEVDEATLPQAARAIQPRVIAFTNLFRDQLDRYGEVDSIAALWRQAVAALPVGATIALNADDPSVAALRREEGRGKREEGRGKREEERDGETGTERGRRVLTFGVEDVGAAEGGEGHPADARWCGRCGTEFTYGARFFWHVGHWSCPGCGDRRPAPDIAAVSIATGPEATGIEMRTPAGSLAVRLPLAGLYNVYNALAATAAALTLGAPLDAVKQGLESFGAAFGRQERLRVRGRDVRLYLCKNPAGVNQVLRTIAGAGAGGEGSPHPLHFLIVLNDGIADGRDVSWIWDVDYEALAGRTALVVAAGTRAADMALRLKYAGLGDVLAVEEDTRRAVSHALSSTPAGAALYVLPTYTAMLDVRDRLAALAGKGRFWEE